MLQSATITSKLQLTIPAGIAKKVGVIKGDKVTVSDENGRVILTPIRHLVEELAGSLETPEKWKEEDIDEIIKKAKQEYFKNKKT